MIYGWLIYGSDEAQISSNTFNTASVAAAARSPRRFFHNIMLIYEKYFASH